MRKSDQKQAVTLDYFLLNKTDSRWLKNIGVEFSSSDFSASKAVLLKASSGH